MWTKREKGNENEIVSGQDGGRKKEGGNRQARKRQKQRIKDQEKERKVSEK